MNITSHSPFADVRSLSNRSHVQECHEQVHQIILDYCVNCYPNVPVSIATTTTTMMTMLLTQYGGLIDFTIENDSTLFFNSNVFPPLLLDTVLQYPSTVSFSNQQVSRIFDPCKVCTNHH